MKKKMVVFNLVLLLTMFQLVAGGLAVSKERLIALSKDFSFFESMTAEECYEKYQKYLEIAGDYIYENNDEQLIKHNKHFSANIAMFYPMNAAEIKIAEAKYEYEL